MLNYTLSKAGHLLAGLCISTVLLFSTVSPVRAQYYSSGESPARLRWRQINTQYFQVLFPQDIDSLAERYAYMLNCAAPVLAGHLRIPSRPMPVILLPYNLHSNGMVVWAPRRMELYTTPSEDSHTLNWEKQLVVHEMRHFVQMEGLNTGFTRFASYIIGQQALGLTTGLYTPKWLLEGDATLTETVLTQSGRGRQADFLLPYRAYAAENRDFSWEKWRLGSLRDFIPDAYALGYLKLSGSLLADSLSNRSNVFEPLDAMYRMIGRNAWNPFILHKAQKRYLGGGTRKVWDTAQNYYKEMWELLDKTPDPGLVADTTISAPSKAYIVYDNLLHTADGEFYATSYGLDHSHRLVRIQSDGRPKRIRPMGTINGQFAEMNGRLYWSEIVSGPRWAHENFSNIQRFDPKTRQRKALSQKGRYADICPLNHYNLPGQAKEEDDLLAQEDLLAAVHKKVEGGCEIHILNPENGHLVKKFQVPGSGFSQDLEWDPQQQVLYVNVVVNNGAAIWTLHTETGEWEVLLPAQNSFISDLKYEDGCVYFSSDRNGTDNLYRLRINKNLDQSTVEQLTEAPLGYGRWDYGKDGHYMTSYSTKGYTITYRPREEFHVLDTMSVWEFKKPASWESADLLSQRVNCQIDTLSIPDNPQMESRPYNKVLNSLRIHSWAPVFIDLDRIDDFDIQEWEKSVSLGATILSQNSLGTLSGRLGYAWSNGFHSGHARFTYSGLFPVFEFNLGVNQRHKNQYSLRVEDKKKVLNITETSKPFVQADLTSYIPLHFNSGGWVRSLTPSLRFSINNDAYYQDYSHKFQNYQFLRGGIQYSQYQQLCQRDIFPRLGFGVSAQTGAVPAGGENFGGLYYASAFLYHPGFARNHGIRWRFACQEQTVTGKNFFLNNLINRPRGFKEDIMDPTQFFVSFDYAFPIICEINIPAVFYLKRLSIIPFADGLSTTRLGNFYSVGAEILLDCHFFRIGNTISTGVRWAHTSTEGSNFEFLFSIEGL